MTTELRKGGDFTKIMLNGYLRDITNNEEILINIPAIKKQQTLSYYINKERYTLQIVSPNKLILNKTNDEIDSKLSFELNKLIPAIYIIKENNLSIKINIRTTHIEVNEKNIRIKYNVIDSNTNYEYYIEMSE